MKTFPNILSRVRSRISAESKPAGATLSLNVDYAEARLQTRHVDAILDAERIFSSRSKINPERILNDFCQCGVLIQEIAELIKF